MFHADEIAGFKAKEQDSFSLVEGLEQIADRMQVPYRPPL